MKKQFVMDVEIPDLDIEVEIDANGEECSVVSVSISGLDITKYLKRSTLGFIESTIEDEHLSCEHEFDSSEGFTCLNCGAEGLEGGE